MLKLFYVFAFLLPSILFGQRTYQHGTCVLALWDAQTAVLISDMKSVDQLGRASEASKTLIIDSTTAIGVVGMAFSGLPGRVDWDALQRAKEIVRPVNGDQSRLENELVLWVQAAQDAYERGYIKPLANSPDQARVVNLVVLSRDPRSVVHLWIAALRKNGAEVSPEVKEGRPGLEGEQRFVPFGKCGDYFFQEAKGKGLLPDEFANS